MNTVQIQPGPIDPILKLHRKDTRFVLGPGRYTTAGAWAFADFDFTMVGPNCDLLGAGPEHTHIEIADYGTIPKDAAQVECLTAGSRKGICDRVGLAGFTLNWTEFEQAPASALRYGIVGVHVWSDRAEVSDIAITGISGVRPKGPGEPSREGFGLLVNQAGIPLNPGCSTVKDIRVRLIDTPPPELTEIYACGAYLGVELPCATSHFERVGVHNPSSVPAHAAFGINGGVTARGLWNTGRWNRAVFCDTAGGEGTSISDSNLRAARVAVEFRGAKVTWRDIIVRDSFIRLLPTPGSYAAALVLTDDTPPGITPYSEFDNVQIRSCVIRGVLPPLAKNDKAPDFYFGSLDASNATTCGVFASTISLPLAFQMKAPPITARSRASAFSY